MASVVVMVLGIALGFRPDDGLLGVVLAIGLLLVFAFSLSWVWTSIGLSVQKPETVMQLSMTVLFPLTFASNVFVDPATMPGWVQAFVKVNPVTHLTTAARGLMHGNVDAGQIGWVLVWSAALGTRVRAAHDAPLQQGALSRGHSPTSGRACAGVQRRGRDRSGLGRRTSRRRGRAGSRGSRPCAPTGDRT